MEAQQVIEKILSEAKAEAAEPESAAAEPEAAPNASPSFPAPGGAGSDAPRPLLSKRPPKPAQSKRSLFPAPAGERTAAMGDSPPKSEAGSLDLANALRVGVKPSSRDDRLLMMRLLGPEEEPAPGYRPALVVLLDSAGNGTRPGR